MNAKLPQGGADAFKKRLESFVGLPFAGHEREWFELASELQLVDEYLLAINPHLVAVVQRRKRQWRRSTNPALYVRVNVERRVERERRDVAGGEIPFSDISPDHPDRAADIQALHPLSTADSHYSKLIGECRDAENSILTQQEVARLQLLLSDIADEGEREAVVARAVGMSRQKYVEEGFTPEERKRRAAAWKRADRHDVLGSLRKKLREVVREDAAERQPFTDRGARGTGGGRRTTSRLLVDQ